jgi:hypothetical protein
MDEERKKILEMVAEGKISAGDGAKLLSALESGSPETRGPGRQRRAGAPRPPRALEAIASTLSGIGPAVRNAVESAMSTFDIDSGDSFDTEVYEELDVIDHTTGPVEVPEGCRLVFRTRKRDGGDLRLQGRGEATLALDGDPGSLKVMGDGEMIVVVWGEGLLKAGVPASAPVEVRTTGGDVNASGMSRELRVKTLGGSITMEDVRGALSAKTMGGSILLAASGGLSGACVAKTMGGDISVSLPVGSVSSLSAKTLGGEVGIDGSLGEVELKGGPGSGRGTLSCEGGEGSSLSVKTLGGNISVERREDG